MEETFPYLWIDRKDRKRCVKYSAKATSIRVKYENGIDPLLIDQVDALADYLRKRYYFPVRCNIHITDHKSYRSDSDGHIFYGVFYDNKDVYRKRKLYPEIYVAGRLYRSSSIEQILYTILHELSHYYQWFFDEIRDRTDRSIEIEATKWARIILEEYKESQTISTPFGKLNIYVDGAPINYLPIKLRYDRPPCKERPLSACYRIKGIVSNVSEVKCVIETTEDVDSSPESGEDYICTTLTKDNVMLTVGTEAPSYGKTSKYSVRHIENGLIFTDFSEKTKLILGVAWVTDADDYDTRTWYAADPTLSFDKELYL